MPLSVGMRRTPVAVQTETETRDAYGQSAKTWATVETIRGLVRTPNGREIFDAGQRKAIGEIVIEAGRDAAVLYANGTLTEVCRLLINGVQYGIEWVNNVDNLNRQLIIHCKKQALPVRTP